MRLQNVRLTCAVLHVGLGLLGTSRVALGQAERTTEGTAQQATTTRAARGATWLRVTGEQINVRSRPDANSVALMRVEPDDVLRAVDQDQYGWYRILPPEGAFSYVSAEHVDRRGPSEGIVSVGSGTLRVRVGSTLRDLDPLQCEVQILLERGTLVRIVGVQGGWLKIVPPAGVYAYVSNQHVEPVSEEVAARLRGGRTPTTQAVATTVPAQGGRAGAGTSQPAAGPDVSGPWGAAADPRGDGNRSRSSQTAGARNPGWRQSRGYGRSPSSARNRW